MRAALALIVVAGVAAGCGGGTKATSTVTSTTRPHRAAFRLALAAPTHTPRVGKEKWWYVVRATAAGKPARGRLTVEVVDPLGTAHLAEVGTSTRKLHNYPFSGRYRDFAQWPPASRGYRLTFRVIVQARGASRAVDYWVRPR